MSHTHPGHLQSTPAPRAQLSLYHLILGSAGTWVLWLFWSSGRGDQGLAVSQGDSAPGFCELSRERTYSRPHAAQGLVPLPGGWEGLCEIPGAGTGFCFPLSLPHCLQTAGWEPLRWEACLQAPTGPSQHLLNVEGSQLRSFLRQHQFRFAPTVPSSCPVSPQ